MLLTIDVGNTDSVFGLWSNKQFLDSIRISTQNERTSYEWGSLIGLWLEKKAEAAVQAAVICSVVAGVNERLCAALNKLGIHEVREISRESRFPFQIEKALFPTIGTDRLVNAAGGVLYYGSNLIIIDIGTAITFCVIKDACFLGGVIAPGIQASALALSQKTSGLFMVASKKKKTAIAEGTKEAMENGLYFGWRGLIREISGQLKKELLNEPGDQPCVLATGGIAANLGFSHEIFDVVDPNLTLRGLMELYYLNP